MKNEIIKIEYYGLEEAKANELTVGLKVVRDERELLIKEFDSVSELELSEDNLHLFKELRLKIVKNRTQGINKWHKTNKEYFLTGGKFVDATRNRECDINEKMESVLMDAEKHFENLEKQRIDKLQSDRVELLKDYVEFANDMDLAIMEQDVFDSYLATKKQAHFDYTEAEKKRESERLAKIEADRLEQLRIKEENAKLIAEAEAKDKLDKIESDKQAAILQKVNDEKLKIELELKSKKEAEQKAIEENEERLQLELNKGDSDKVKDLIIELNGLKSKYKFKSAKNKKMYSDVGLLIDKVTNFIDK